MSILDLARSIWFGNVKAADILASEWDYRKGKGVADINHAMRKASKFGRGKVEFELDLFEVYLKSILKKKAVVRT